MSEPIPEAPFDAGGQLGCAQSYTAAVHWRGGAQVYIPPNLISASLTDVAWERRLSETSSAQIVLGKRQLAEECCGLLGAVFPWCHELTIYRESVLVWQGPIITVTEDDNTVVLDAMDVTAWLARLVNTHSLNHSTPSDITAIAREVITENLNDTALSTPVRDWAGILPYLKTTTTGVEIRLKRRSIWSDTVLNIVNNLAAKGLEWTTVGRRMVIREPVNSRAPARARMTPDDLPGGVQVVRDGQDTATRVFATSQTTTDDGITVSTAVKASSAVCGRIDQIVRDTPRVDVETDAEEQARHAAIRARREFRIQTERNDANHDINVILDGPDTPAERKAAEARRKLRDERIDGFRDDYEDELEASDAEVAQEQREAVTAVLVTEAKAALKGRWPPPVGITVQDGAQLSPTAPITVSELVPGERIDVITVGFCQRVSQAMRLSRVQAAWGQSGEAIGISLVPLSELAEVDT